MKAVPRPRWMRLEQRIQGVVVLPGEPRPEAIESALERAGYRRVADAAPAEVARYREAATPSLSMTFRRSVQSRVAPAVESVRVWRADDGTMGYSVVLLPLWLLQVLGILVAAASVGMAAVTGEPRSLAGLIVAGILLGLPKLWIDDAHHVVREALGEAPPVDPVVAPAREVEPLEPPEEAAPVAPERVRVATDEPALAAAAKTAADAAPRRDDVEPEDEVEALERAARRGGGRDD